ncbi:hypothetical protein F5Y03DRAFT_124118 [Xylaria venustula]|nr:hypothetical protein F5Y03DRAFT_124118 [Xylaria venustula]
MFFIVSNSKDTLKLDHHMNRLGYHFRHSIVEEARKILKESGHHEQAAYVHEPGKPEPIPSSQREIDLEADAVLRDLFPRIPNTDRQEIIDHAFKKDGKFNGEIKVGMAKDITLARRVQLAALAHIRHTHTRYDELLRESDWANARKAVEKPCLDIIVKWRGDEETGRDQLDEILREVIEISDTETETEDEESSAEIAHIHVPRTRPTAALLPSRAVSQLSRPITDRLGVDSQASSPALASPRTPSGVRKRANADKRKARKTQQRFKRYAAAAEALAISSNQNGSPEAPSTPEFVATPTEAGRRQGSAHPVNTYLTTPRTVMRETYIPRISHAHTAAQGTPNLPPNGMSSAETIGVSRASAAQVIGATEQFIRVPDAQRPKVGPYSAQYSQPPPPPLSPIRLGLQDMLLPSIEPRSPDVAHLSLDASRRVPRMAQHTADVPRVISRNIAQPVVPNPHPRSPGTLIQDNEAAAKRRRITTYFPEDFEELPKSADAHVASRSQDGAPRPQFEYPIDRQLHGLRGPERVLYHDVPWTPSHEVRVVRPEDGTHRSRGPPIPVTGEERAFMGSKVPDHSVYQSNMRAPTHQGYPFNRAAASLRSKANPIIINGDRHYEPRRIVEVRSPPTHEIYRTASPRGRDIYSPHYPGNARIRGSPRVVYVDESTGRARSESGNRRHVVLQSQHGVPAGERPARFLSPDTQSQHQPRTLEQDSRYTVPHTKGVVRVDNPEQNPPAWPSATSRGIQESLQEAPRLERFAEPQRRPDFGIAPQTGPQQYSNSIIYREIRPEVAGPTTVGYERGTQPFPVHPAPSSYVEIRGPSPHRRIPGHRDMIYVE